MPNRPPVNHVKMGTYRVLTELRSHIENAVCVLGRRYNPCFFIFKNTFVEKIMSSEGASKTSITSGYLEMRSA